MFIEYDVFLRKLIKTIKVNKEEQRGPNILGNVIAKLIRVFNIILFYKVKFVKLTANKQCTLD